MPFRVSVDIDGVIWKMDTLALGASDLDKPLAIFGGYMKKKAIERYKAQAFAPLAETTLKARAQRGIQSMERKLQSDVRRAFKRARKSRGRAPRGLLGSILSDRAAERAMEDVLSSQTRGAQNRMAVLAAFQDKHRRGLKEKVNAKPLSIKQSASLDARTARAVARSVGRPILGGLPRTLQVTVNKGEMTLRSRTHQEWSEAHNEGATVGHGAKLPKRQTIVFEDSDKDVLVSILKDHLLIPIQKGMHGPGY